VKWEETGIESSPMFKDRLANHPVLLRSCIFDYFYLQITDMPDPFTLSIKDENFSGNILQEVTVGFRHEWVTIAEIIEARVRQEVEAYNNKLPEYYRGLIEPTEAEKTINGFRLKTRKAIDAEQQVYVALDAFQKNGFFVLVDNQQCVSLEEKIRLSKTTRISFVKLTPLVGG
jgi:hypothetical protein